MEDRKWGAEERDLLYKVSRCGMEGACNTAVPASVLGCTLCLAAFPETLMDMPACVRLGYSTLTASVFGTGA